MAEQERFLYKFLRDAALTILGGIVIEPTLHQVNFEVGPHLRQIWFGIFAFLTLDALWRNGRLRRWCERKYSSLGKWERAMSYAIVAVIGAVSFCLYWLAVTSVIKEPKRLESQQPISPVFKLDTRPQPYRGPKWTAKHSWRGGSVHLNIAFSGLLPGNQELRCLVIEPNGKTTHAGRVTRAGGIVGLGSSADFPESFGVKNPPHGNYRVLWVLIQDGDESTVAQDFFDW